MNIKKLDTSDPGLAANINARAAILVARLGGYMIENTVRLQYGEMPMYRQEAFEYAIRDFFPELYVEDGDA